MKRILSFILALAMTLPMAACGGGESSGGTDSEPTPTPTPAPKVLSSVQEISKYDEKTITNDYTGLEFALTGGWSMMDRDTVCTLFMPGVTAQQLEEMTTEQLNQVPVIYDWAAMDTYGNVVMVMMVNYRTDGLTFEEYLKLFRSENTMAYHTVSEEKTVVLSGVEYTNFTAFSDDGVLDICYLDREDGCMVAVAAQLKEYTSPGYFHAQFNGGANGQINTENVPGLFEYDSENHRVINTDTGIEIDIPDGWAVYSKEYMAEIYYKTDVESLNNMTGDDFARLGRIDDIELVKDDISISVYVSYLSRKTTSNYGMSAQDMAEYYCHTTNASEEYVYVTDDISFAGQNYWTVERYNYNNDATTVFMFRELNEDYMVCVSISAKGSTDAYELREIFAFDNDTDMLIKRSQPVEGKYQYHNPYTDVRINHLKDWVNADQAMIKLLYKDTLTVEDVENWTDDDYMSASIIPDFGVSSPDGKTYLFVYYVNLNKVNDIDRKDCYSYYQKIVEGLENSGTVTLEKDISYGFDSDIMEYYLYEGQSSDGSTRMQVAVGDISEDYVFLRVYRSPMDSGLPKIPGMIVD